MNLLTRGWTVLPGLLALTLLAMTTGVARARPVFIENVSTIPNPAPTVWTEFPVAVAVDGDAAIVAAQRWTYPTPEHGRVHQTAFLYRRSGSGWALVRQLEETVVDGGMQNSLSVAMQGGLAAVHTTPMTIYQRGASGWTLAPSQVEPGDNPGFDLEIDGGSIVNGEGMCNWNASVVEKSTDGVWRRSDTLHGSFRGCVDYFRGGSVDVSGDLAILHQQDGMEIPFGQEQAWIFRRQDAGWARQGIVQIPWDPRFWALGQVAARGGEFFVSAGHELGIQVVRDVPGGGFQVTERIRPLDSLMGGGETFQLEQSPDYLLQKANLPDRGPDALGINVYQRRDGTYAHTAVLVARNDRWTWFPYEGSASNMAISGRTVLATDHNEQVVHHFELPADLAAPEPRQDTFATGSAPDWTLSSGHPFTVLRGDRSRVMRQAQTTGDSRAIYEPSDWTSQAIEVDVTPGEFPAGASALSLITRWQGPHNYYEFVWGPQRFEFRRMAGGTLRTLMSHPGEQFNPPRPGRSFRVRLESIGTLHRVYIDGLLYFSITSTGPTRGRVGLGTYQAGVDFDNVLVTPTPVYTMYANRFDTDAETRWLKAGGDWRFDTENPQGIRLVQHALDCHARVTIGVPATEQSVRATTRVMQFAAPNGTQRRWFGVVARYVDEDNHYILALRNSNSLVLSKRVNGRDTTLGNFTVDVVPARDYDIRLDAIGSQLRAYLDGRLLFEASDDSHARGRSGLTTFKAQAEFSEFVAYQP